MQYETVIGLGSARAAAHRDEAVLRVRRALRQRVEHERVRRRALGLPGALPAMNETAVRLAVRAAIALGCTVSERSIFARKQYFYPDLPKGYQISQYEQPFSKNGHLDVETDGATRRVRILRAHMEEDAGKSVHGVGGDSLVDLNRAGSAARGDRERARSALERRGGSVSPCAPGSAHLRGCQRRQPGRR